MLPSLYSGAFNCGTTGCTPQGMIEDRDGNFYGTAITGGTSIGNAGGTVFRIAAGPAQHLQVVQRDLPPDRTLRVTRSEGN